MKKKELLGIMVGVSVIGNIAVTDITFGKEYTENNELVTNKVSDKNILSNSNATVSQMESWARSKGATEIFVSLAKIYVRLAPSHGGINPVVAYAQSAVETGYGKFGGVIDESYKNPCGMKNSATGPDSDPSAHKRFSSWEEGISAHLDHLALYAGASGYPKADTKDPRHFPYLHGKSPTVNGLSGSWASDTKYGPKILNLVAEIEKNSPSTGGSIDKPSEEGSDNKPSDEGGNDKLPEGGTNNETAINKNGKVTASALNVRAGAGTNNKVLGTLKNGANVTVVSQSNGWYKIKYGSGYGYVSSQYVTIGNNENSSTDNNGSSNDNNSNSGSSDNNININKKGTVRASVLNVRSGPGTNNKIIGNLKNGAKVNVLEEKGEWYKIEYGKNYGYVSAQYISLENSKPNVSGNSKIVTASVLNVRAGAGTGYRTIGSLKNGTRVEVISSINGWYKIKYNNGIGYVSGRYLK